MGIFERNLNTLEKRFPEIAKQILSRREANYTTELCHSSDGLIDLKILLQSGDHVLLHGGNIRKSYIDTPLKNLEPDFNGIGIFLGFGLAYTVETILKERPLITNILIFEPEIQILYQLLKNRDVSHIIEDSRVELVVGKDIDVSKILNPYARLFMSKHAYIHRIYSYEKIDPRTRDLFEKIFSEANNLNVSGATVVKAGANMSINRIANLDVLSRSYNIFDLQDTFKDIPAVLVAAGPSLDKNISLLKNLKGKAVIFCVDSALNALKKHDIIPHFISSIDYQELNYEKIANWSTHQETNISLIYLLNVCPAVPKRFPARHLIFAPIQEIFTCILNQTMFSRAETISCPSTVAHLNLMAAQVMGANPIIFLGQDLTSETNKSHAKETIFTYNPTELKDNIKIKTDAWHNGTIYTNRTYWQMKSKFEEIILEKPEITYINATEGGIHIDGAKDIPLKTVIYNYLNNTFEIEKIINQKVHNIPPINKYKAINTLKDLHKELNTACNLAKDGKKSISQIKNSGTLKNKKINKYINKTNKYLHKIESNTKIIKICEEFLAKYCKKLDEVKEQQTRNNPTALQIDFFYQVFKTYQKVFGEIAKRLNFAVEHLEEEDLLRRKLAADNNNPKNHYLIAKCFFETESFLLARYHYQKALDSGYNNKELLKNLAKTLVHLGDLKKLNQLIDNYHLPKSTIKQIDDLKNDYAIKYLKLSKINLNNLDELPNHIIKHFIFKAKTYAPNNPDIDYVINKLFKRDLGIAEQAINQKDVYTSYSIANDWISIFPNNPELLHILAKTKILQGDLVSATGFLEKAMKYAPDDPDIYITAALIFIETNNPDQAIMALQKATSLNPDYISYWADIANILFEKNLFKQALVAYEQAFIANPNYSEYLIRMSQCYLKLGQLEAAREALHQAVKLRPGDQLIAQKLDHLNRVIGYY